MSHTTFPKPWNLVYVAARIVLWSVFFFGMLWFAFSVIFPSRAFFFDFNNSKAQKNTLTGPRTTNGDARGDGRLGAGETLLINASVFGDFSDAQVSFSGDESGANMTGSTVSVRRSQQAFFYPEGKPAFFPEGTLLKSDGSYYIVTPDESVETFYSSTIQDNRSGYDPQSFLEVPKELLSGHLDDQKAIIDDYSPNGTFFQIEDVFYELKGGKLFPFVSREAFLARYPEKWALKEDLEFLELYKEIGNVSDTWIGYPSGSLLSWGDGVFLMDKNSPRPILGVDIFLSLGYSWDDVIPASDEEISLTEKGKFVDFSVPHPDGTVFLDTKENRYFLVDGGKKREILGEALLQSWLGKRHPILVSSESLTTKASCTLKESFSLFSSAPFTCTLPLDSLAHLPGDTYEFSLDTPRETDLRRMDVVFESSVKQQTFFTTLSKLKTRVLSRYIPVP